MIETGDGWTLHLGDCLAGMRELADDSVDVTITDPPYEAEAHTLQRRQKGKATQPGGGDAFREVNPAALPFAAITADQRLAVAAEIARITRHCAIVFCQVEAVPNWRDAFAAADMPYRRCIPWNKPDAMPSLHGRWPGQEFEAIALMVHVGARPCPIGGKSISYNFPRDVFRDGAPHPTTKPLTLMRALVEHFSEPDDLVLDCFAGSGTTGVACRQLGRRFIGWELDANYHAIACRRLRGESARIHETQLDLLGGLP